MILKNNYETNINNYQNQNLRGKSFRGKNLAWANFKDANIRGADFTGATLVGADFCGAKAGLQEKRKLILVLLSFILSGLSAFVTTLPAFWVTFSLLPNQQYQQYSGLTFFTIMLVIFLTTSLHKSLIFAIGIMPLAFAATLPIVGVILLRVGPGAPTAAGAGAGIGLITVLGSVLVSIAITSSQILDGLIPAIFTVTGVTIGGVTATIMGRAAALGGELPEDKAYLGVIMAIIVIIVITLLSIYIAWITLAKDKNLTFIRSFAINFAGMGGTSFRNANLTEADFTRSKLKSTDFRRANVTRTRWYQANLESAKLDGTILNNSVVRELLVTLKGNNESERFVGLDFHGANLVGAELVNTNFTKANFSDAILTGAILVNTDFTQADLSRVNFVKSNLQGAILTKALALGTIFTEAKLTGVSLESWVIDHTTLLEDSFCDYVYIKEKEKEPYPSSGKFLPGDFAKLFQEVVDTVDLIFHNGINKEAFVYSWQKIQVENEGIYLDIQGIERKSDNIVIVKVNVSKNDEIGYIYTNSSEKLTIADLKFALSHAIENGLKLAIFNSCDGMGLALNLANLNIPQMIVMREWIPDEVAQEFLRNFFKAYVGGKSLYQSVRDAREQLHHWENSFPCATWLPVICQNPTEVPPTWRELQL